MTQQAVMKHPLSSDILKHLDDGGWRDMLKQGKLSMDDICDLYCDFKELSKAIGMVTTVLRTMTIARLQMEEDKAKELGDLEQDKEATGWTTARAKVQISTAPGRTTYDMKSMAEEMGPNFMEKFSRQGEPYQTVRYKLLD